MPRISSKKKEYMIFDLPFWLIKEAHKRGLHQKDLAEVIGITPQAFSQRLGKKNGKPKDMFSYGELLTLFRFLEVPDEEKSRLLTL